MDTPASSISLYQPKGDIRPAAVFNLLVSLTLAAAIVGFAAFLAGKFMYLILVYPVVMGFLIGAAGKWMVKLYAIRNLTVCRLASVLAGLMTLTVLQYAGFMELRARLTEETWVEPVLELEEFTPAERQLYGGGRFTEAEYQEYLKVAKAAQSFPAYVDLEAEMGVEISRATGMGGFNLGKTGTWIYWILEWVAVSVICYYVLRSQARAPFCDAAHSWMEPLDGFYLKNRVDEVMRAIDTGNMVRMKPVHGTPPDGALLLQWYQSPARDLAEKDMVVFNEFKLDNKRHPVHNLMATYEVRKPAADQFLNALREQKEKSVRRRNQPAKEPPVPES